MAPVLDLFTLVVAAIGWLTYKVLTLPRCKARVKYLQTATNMISMDTPPGVAGSCHVFTGPMFSSKTSRLLSELTTYFDVTGNKPLLIGHCWDSRAPGSVASSHSSQFTTSNHLDSLKSNTLMDLDVSAYTVIGIDEAQFFPDLPEFVFRCLDQGKHMYVAGLDGTFEQKTFGRIHELLPRSEEFIKLNAICSRCLELAPRPIRPNQLSSAPFTMRMQASTELVVIGGADMYMAVCRNHLPRTLSDAAKLD